MIIRSVRNKAVIPRIQMVFLLFSLWRRASVYVKFEAKRSLSFISPVVKTEKILQVTSVNRKMITSYGGYSLFFPADVISLWRQQKIFLFFAFLAMPKKI